MTKTLKSTAALVLAATVLASGSAFAKGEGKADARDKKVDMKGQGKKANAQESGTKKIELKVGSKEVSVDIPTGKESQYEGAAKSIPGDVSKAMVAEDLASLVKGIAEGDADLAKAAVNAALSGKSRAKEVASIAARASAGEDGFKDNSSEVENVKKFVDAYNSAAEANALEDAGRALLSKDASREDALKKAEEIFKACKERA